MPSKRTVLTDDTVVRVPLTERDYQIPDRSLRRDGLCVYLNLPQATFDRWLELGIIPGPDIDAGRMCQFWTADRCLAIKLLLPHWCRVDRERCQAEA